MYNAIITRVRNVRTFPDADRLKLATCVGNQVVIGLDHQEDELGIYFPSDGQLSHDFCYNNNLYRDATKNKDVDAKPGMFDDNRRVRAQKFRKQNSDGFWLTLDCVKFTGIKERELTEGLEFDTLNGIAICNKYINPATLKAAKQNQPKKTKTAKTSIMFKEHIDTKHIGANMDKIEENDLVIFTEKLHGTSHREGHVLVERNLTYFEKFLSKFFKVNINKTEWAYLSGTRRVVIQESKRDGVQYHDPTIREKAHKLFKDNLRKGETAYLEIVGFEPTGAGIMNAHNTAKTKDKDFTKTFGEVMQYSYGCESTECDFYVYRMTMTNEDGHTIDYSWDDVKKRCSELGVKHVPELCRFTVKELKAIEASLGRHYEDDRDFQIKLEEIIAEYGNGASVVDQKVYREGTCIRLESGLAVRIFKFKNWFFKTMEDFEKESGAVDTEEVEAEALSAIN